MTALFLRGVGWFERMREHDNAEQYGKQRIDQHGNPDSD